MGAPDQLRRNGECRAAQQVFRAQKVRRGRPLWESNPEQLRLMAVHAHPDDESSKGAATMARYVREGVEVMVCTLTGGERGDILNPAMDRPEVKADIPAVRRPEMARAREIRGLEQRFLRIGDAGRPR